MLFLENTIPRWTPEFNVGYGDPYFLFSYFLPYLIGATLHEIGFSFLNSLKILLAGSYILSGITMYRYMKEEFGEKAGIVSSVFYLFTPYHLVDLHFRVTIAENLSFLFLPLILMYTRRNFITPTLKNIFFGALSYSLLILSHQVIALAFIPISFIYGLVVWSNIPKKTIKQFLPYLVMLFVGFLYSSFYWIPVILEAKYTQASLTHEITVFPTLAQLIYSPWRGGLLFQGPQGELSFLIGYTQILVIFISSIFLWKNKIHKEYRNVFIFFLGLFFSLTILMLSISKPLWSTIPFLSYFQYSYRLLELTCLAIAIIAGLLSIKILKKPMIILICIITMMYTILNWGNRRTLPKVTSDNYFSKELALHPDVGMYLEPSSPIWIDLKKSQVRVARNENIQVISGSAQIKELKRSSVSHEYKITAHSNVVIKENTLYFPGWNVLSDGENRTIEFTNKLHPGIILFSLKKGVHSVIVTYEKTLDRQLGDLLTILSAIATMCIGISLLVSCRVKKYFHQLLFCNDSNISSTKRKRNITKFKK